MKNILYTKHFDTIIKENVNVILSPQFYWIQKIDIPLKSLKEAKEIAHTFFELDAEYFYSAVEVESKYFAIAIDKNLQLNIKDKYIKSIHIAQTEFFEYECVKIDDTHYLQKIDDIVFCFPYTQEKYIEIDEIIDRPLCKYNLDFKDIINMDFLNTIFLSLILILSLTFFVQWYQYINISSKLDIQKRELVTKNNLPFTSFEIDSILLNLQNIDNKQIKIRKDLEFFSNIHLNKNDKLLSIVKLKNYYIIKINTTKNYDKYFQKKFKIINSTNLNHIYEVKLR